MFFYDAFGILFLMLIGTLLLLLPLATAGLLVELTYRIAIFFHHKGNVESLSVRNVRRSNV